MAVVKQRRNFLSKLWASRVFASKVPTNELGHAVKKHLNRYGVDTSQLLMGGPRLGTYYLEAGVGERAQCVYDRAAQALL